MHILSDDRRMIQETARQFAMEHVMPLAKRLDPEKGKIPRELIDEMAELGYFAILIPEAYGGLGLGAYEYCLVAEQLSRAWMSVGSLIARCKGLIGALKALSPEQKAEYLPGMVRKTFGQPIADHQAVQFMLAECAMDIYAAKSMIRHCAWLVDEGRPATKEVSIVKASATEMVGRVMDRAIQIHGGMGLTNELRLEAGFRWARTMRIPDGTSEIQRRTIARRLLDGDTAF
ncbi:MULTISPECIES: acyl-CoA dehydrogenase family protein [Paraburkholderia]|uniref:acyl-CoA dehydrogenase family protein n=1 Tax=Paraburkholderia TaxID=1822464 RepID=UPI001D13129B|nr:MULTISPECIES: acyl-CoA dehydrogenase family protein [Paraburkholderia]